MIISLLIILTAFLFGSIPSGLVVAKIFGVNIREVGSGNIGATNVLRCVGKKAGYLTFLMDMAKGVIPLLLIDFLVSEGLVFEGGLQLSNLVPLMGLAAILGHCFSPFLKWNGGKGVATSFAVFLYIFPLGALLSFLLFAIVFYSSRYVSLASVVAAIAYPLFCFLFSEGGIVTLVGVIAGSLIIFRHKANIIRLIEGTENKFSRGSSSQRI